MEFGKFFYAGIVVDQIVLDCYRLAKYYSRDPDEFLNKPMSVVQRHMRWTSKLIEEQARQREAEDDAI